MKTLTQAWEEAGRPRPPFYFEFAHPDEWRHQVFDVDLVKIMSGQTWFRDNSEYGEFNGDKYPVRWLRVGKRK